MDDHPLTDPVWADDTWLFGNSPESAHLTVSELKETASRETGFSDSLWKT